MYKAILGEACDTLPNGLKLGHSASLHARGSLHITRKSGWLWSLLCDLLKLPPAGDNVDTEISVVAQGDALVWNRRFGAHALTSRQMRRGTMMLESFGPGCFWFALEPDSSRIAYRQKHFRFLGVPLPAALAPRVVAEVADAGDGWLVDVEFRWPRNVALCRYTGKMTPQ